MITIILTVCLVQQLPCPASAQQELVLQPMDISLQLCSLRAQQIIASWVAEHLELPVVRYKCVPWAQVQQEKAI